MAPGQSSRIFALNCGRGSVGCSKLRMISTMPNSPMTKRKEIDPVPQLGNAECIARETAVDVRADEPKQQPDQNHADGLDDGAVRQNHRGDKPENHQRKVFGRVEPGEDRKRQPEGCDKDRAETAGKKRSHRSHAQGRAGAALLRHRWPSRQVTIEAASPGIFTRIEVVEPPYCAP